MISEIFLFKIYLAGIIVLQIAHMILTTITVLNIISGNLKGIGISVKRALYAAIVDPIITPIPTPIIQLENTSTFDIYFYLIFFLRTFFIIFLQMLLIYK